MQAAWDCLVLVCDEVLQVGMQLVVSHSSILQNNSCKKKMAQAICLFVQALMCMPTHQWVGDAGKALPGLWPVSKPAVCLQRPGAPRRSFSWPVQATFSAPLLPA